MVNAIVLSGDCEENGNSKALMKIASRFMVEYIINSLRDSKCINKIFIVGNDVIKKEIGQMVDGFIHSSGGILDNIQNVINYIGEDEVPCIICTSDIPLVKGEAIRDFIQSCQERNLEFGYPIIDKRLNDLKYPEVERTYIKMKDGTYTGGNIVYVKPWTIKAFGEKARMMIENRKNPFKMGKLLGFKFLAMLILGRVSVEMVERRIETDFNIRCGAIRTEYPEIGNDVDKPSDVEFVMKHI